jgi:hypothetical protein
MQDIDRDARSPETAMEASQRQAPARHRDLDVLVETLRGLKEEAESMLQALSPGTSAVSGDATGVLDSIVRKYRQLSHASRGVRIPNAPEYGVSRLIPLLEDFPVLEYWIYRKAKIDGKPRLTPDVQDLGLAERTKLLIRVRRSPYRSMTLDELIAVQVERLGTFVDLLTRTKGISDRLYEDLYNKHIEMQEDALRAQRNIDGISKYVQKLDKANRESAEVDFDPRSREGLELSTLVTYLQKYSGPITEFFDDCQSTIDWLFEAQKSYRTFEEMIGAYSRMINAIRRRTSNLQSFISDFNQLTMRLKEGEEITRELSNSMVALTSSVNATASELSGSLNAMLEQFGSLDALELPAYVNNILGGPAADLDAAKAMIRGSTLVSLPPSSG